MRGCHCESPIARALSVEAETGKCYPLRSCPDKLRPAFRMVRQQPACESGSGHRWSKEWWRRRPQATTPLSSVARTEVSGSGEESSKKERMRHAETAATGPASRSSPQAEAAQSGGGRVGHWGRRDLGLRACRM